MGGTKRLGPRVYSDLVHVMHGLYGVMCVCVCLMVLHMFEHFLEAQNPIYSDVLDELRSGRKRTHWMWFIFPQLKGLGSSPMSVRFAIEDETQAKAYWEHPVLGPRLRECFDLVEKSGRTPEQIFSPIDAMKYCSSRELFGSIISGGE